uniref:acyltransferase Pun1-like n=1 Tax=Erigeron canadensis TaxID=72917 RepID=UPI001CB8BC10|nr:acyltransferase Pun1-like [Erigeron canadensis]
MTIIVSYEIIKPSSPTSSHLKTYNLSLLDQISMDEFLPMVMFYPNTTQISRDIMTNDLKNSLSQTLTKYFPFAGRLAKTAPAYIDCNDAGAEFFEASIDNTLLDFLQKSQHEDFDQLFPYERVWYESNNKSHDQSSDHMIPLAVQVNHFKCGGVAVAASLSHKIADGTSLIHFLNDWGQTTRFCLKGNINNNTETPIEPEFFSYPNVNLNFNGFSLDGPKDCVTRSFVFPNSKINELKKKVMDMAAESGQPITNLTRVEVLNWLLYKSAVVAANSGFFKPAAVGHVINIRDKMVEQVPKRRIGNLYMIMKILANNENEMKPEVFINELQKQKMKFRALKNIQEAFGLVDISSWEIVRKDQEFIDNAYICTSLCRYPTYEIDFGWGKPLKTTFGGNLRKNTFLLLDAPDGDGIEALVCLGKQDMNILQNDPHLLAFC